jgi:hypothetical protein
MLEQSVSPISSFVSLNYPPSELPEDGSLKLSHLQQYIKRLRYYLDKKITYFAVGEYGLEKMRPHYHLAVFGAGVRNEQEFKKAWYEPEVKYVATVDVGELNIKSAKYICGYTVEKLANKDKRLFGKRKEFMTCSRGKDAAIGLKAVKLIGSNIKKEPYHDKMILRELSLGKQKFPLGRYLTKELNKSAGATEVDFTIDLWNRQEQLFQDHMYNQDDFYESILKEKEDIRKRQKRMHRMFRKRKKI